MKVACYFGGRTNLGGAERRIGRIMNQIAQKGVEVTFVFFLYEQFSDIENEYHKLVGHPFFLKLVGFQSQKELFDYVRKQHFDTVFYTGPYRAMLPFFFAGKLSGSQSVFLQVSTGPSVRQFESTAEMLEFELVARLSDRIDCLYPSTTEAISKRYRRQIVTTTPCPATRFDIFRPLKKEKKIAFISRWVKGKNVDVFVDSMLLIEDYLYEQGYKVLLCGNSRDGSYEKEINEKLKRSNHTDIYIMPGYVKTEEVLPYCEIFISIQNINNYPSQSLLEAIACGCYIIASNEGDTRSIVKDDFGTCCHIEAKEIAEKTVEFVEKSQAEKKEIIRNSSAFAKANFDISHSVQHYLEIIKNPRH